MNLDENTVIVAQPQHVSCDTGEETVLLHVDAGIYFGLEGVAGHVWKLIQKPRSIQSILDCLIEQYDVDVATCRSDLFALTEQLAEKKLIEIR